MKKIGLMMVASIVALFTMVSCGGAGTSAEDRAIEQKIENGEELTSEDYTHIINYVGEYAEKAQEYVVNGGEDANEELAELNEEYPLVDTFRECLKITPLDKFNGDNLKLIGKYVGYIEFSAPNGYMIQTDANAAGMEVATPDSANGVVAGAVDTTKVKKGSAW